mmetsp:Transcript_36429/g.90845  ORF Transcript_36429/g.90845 Transcript_36429/m.90845 type:complete len:264 (-) Transcript_36429:205-996(-)
MSTSTSVSMRDTAPPASSGATSTTRSGYSLPPHATRTSSPTVSVQRPITARSSSPRKSTSASSASSPWKSCDLGWSLQYVPLGSRRYATCTSTAPPMTPPTMDADATSCWLSPPGCCSREGTAAASPPSPPSTPTSVPASVPPMAYDVLTPNCRSTCTGSPTLPSTPSKPRTPACVRCRSSPAPLPVVVTSKNICPPVPPRPAPARCSACHAEGGRTILSSARARMPRCAAASLRVPMSLACHATPSLLARMASSAARSSALR